MTTEPVDFSCRVCGRPCPVAPDPPARAVCEDHCPDHDYQYVREDRGRYCVQCMKPEPED